MKKIISKISQVVRAVLQAPIKIPAKALQILKYVAVGLGIIETVMDKEDENSSSTTDGKEEDNADNE